MAKNCCICGRKFGMMEERFVLEYGLGDFEMCNDCFSYKRNLSAELALREEAIKYLKNCMEESNADSKVRDNIDKCIGKSSAKYEREAREIETIRQREIERVNYAKSFNEFYEYDVVTIINANHGTVNKDKMMEILSEHARNGWKLHTIYSNELGKNATSMLGFGVNSTACEDVLIFERRISNI